MSLLCVGDEAIHCGLQGRARSDEFSISSLLFPPFLSSSSQLFPSPAKNQYKHPPPNDLTHQPSLLFIAVKPQIPHALADLTRFVCAYHADFARPSTRPLPITWSLADFWQPFRALYLSLGLFSSHTRLVFPKSAESRAVPDSRSSHRLDSPFDPTSLSVVIADSFQRLKSSPPLITLFLRIPPQTLSSFVRRLAFYKTQWTLNQTNTSTSSKDLLILKPPTTSPPSQARLAFHRWLPSTLALIRPT